MADQLFIEATNDPTFIPPSDSYLEFFKDSIGKGIGKYYSGIGEVYRSGARYQKGYGLLGVSSNYYRGDGFGSILSSLWRVAFPMIKTGAKRLGSAALDVASNVAADALQGKDIKESAKEHLTTKGTELLKTFQKTSDPESPPISPSPTPVLKAPAPASFRRLPRKRTSPATLARPPKQSKRFPALKYM